MADRASLEEYLFITPETAAELLHVGPTQVPAETTIADIAVLAIDGDPLDVAMAALAQARVIIDEGTSQDFVEALADPDIDEAEAAKLSSAIARRDAAKGLLTEASRRYDTEYNKQRTTTSKWNGGSVLIERDTDKVLDLYDRTEGDDEHPVLVIIENARARAGKDSAINDADMVLRIAFAGEVELLAVLDIVEDAENSDDPDANDPTGSSAGAA